MAKTDFKTIDEYISTFPEEIQEILEKVRKTIHTAVPEVEEVISYQLPAFKSNGFILYIGAYAKHFSISSPPPTFEVFKDKLKEYKVSKSAVQFPYDKPIPVKLIAEIAKYRAAENLKKVTKKS